MHVPWAALLGLLSYNIDFVLYSIVVDFYIALIISENNLTIFYPGFVPSHIGVEGERFSSLNGWYLYCLGPLLRKVEIN